MTCYYQYGLLKLASDNMDAKLCKMSLEKNPYNRKEPKQNIHMYLYKYTCTQTSTHEPKEVHSHVPTEVHMYPPRTHVNYTCSCTNTYSFSELKQ